MDRNSFLSRKTAKPFEVELPDGSKVYARKLTQAEVETLQRRQKSHPDDISGFRYIVSRSVTDEHGTRLLADGDEDSLKSMEFADVEAIANRVLKESGLVKGPN